MILNLKKIIEMFFSQPHRIMILLIIIWTNNVCSQNNMEIIVSDFNTPSSVMINSPDSLPLKVFLNILDFKDVINEIFVWVDSEHLSLNSNKEIVIENLKMRGSNNINSISLGPNILVDSLNLDLYKCFDIKTLLNEKRIRNFLKLDGYFTCGGIDTFNINKSIKSFIYLNPSIGANTEINIIGDYLDLLKINTIFVTNKFSFGKDKMIDNCRLSGENSESFKISSQFLKIHQLTLNSYELPFIKSTYFNNISILEIYGDINFWRKFFLKLRFGKKILFTPNYLTQFNSIFNRSPK